MRRLSNVLLAMFSLVLTFVSASGENAIKISPTIRSVLREPLPAEELSLSQNAAEFVIVGPTFTYRVKKTSGVISGMRVLREGREVVATDESADIQIDGHHFSSELNSCKVTTVSEGKDKIVLRAQGVLRDPGKKVETDYSILHTFFNDGVVVSAVNLIPRADLQIEKAIRYEVPVRGQFTHYLHKRRDEHGDRAVRGTLPESQQAIRLSTLTSCLSVFSPATALAIFTDGGAMHVSQSNLDTARVDVLRKEETLTRLSLSQYLVHIASGDKPFPIKAGQEFSFRVGISVAPNRRPHPRMHDLRMFTWIGDEKYPYPTDDEISYVAQKGFAVFGMHRAGTPGEPRPPIGAMERVIRKVHESGMLFLWTENTDLMYASAPGVQDMKAKDHWSQWQGFNYGGHYKAPMDSYCDLVATCLASPNGLAEYRLATLSRMMDRFDVDGMYLDDNLAYANCTFWKEHGHPRSVYDCLIELHEMNWRRRELLRQRCPHLLLVSHCTQGFVLPVISPFDAQLYGEGYSFGSVENYWDNYAAWTHSMHGQGMIWPGDDEGSRCPASLAYNFDLLTGGGQFTQLDWRLFPKKFSYAKGVTERESQLAQDNNLAQSYFGLHESKPFYFANSSNVFTTTAPQTYASVYHNRMWNDWLIPLANMKQETQKTSFEIRLPKTLGIQPKKNYVLFDVQERKAWTLHGKDLNEAFRELPIPGWSLRLFCLRERSDGFPFHLWGGKRISESWDGRKRKLIFEIDGPAGLKDRIYLGTGRHGIQQVFIASKPASFFFDSVQGLAIGEVIFSTEPLKIEVVCSPDGVNKLPLHLSKSGTAISTEAENATAKVSPRTPAYEWIQVVSNAAFAPRDGAGALVFADKMWLLGGWNPRDKKNFPRICNNEIWNSKDGANWALIKTNTFLNTAFDPTKDWEGRHTGGYAVHRGKMWLIGGDPIQGHYQSDVWNSKDGKTWNFVNKNRPVPWVPRVLHHTVVFKDKIWVMGGQTLPPFAPHEEIFYRDIWNTSDGMNWKQIVPREPYWSARGMIGGSIVFKNQLWILGGGTYDTPKVPQRKFYNDVWSTPDGIQWTRHTESAPWTPRQYHEVAVFDDQMWVLEGYYEKGGNRNDVWYSQDGAHWTELPNTPWKPRHAASVFVHDNALWMVAGNNMESDVWKLVRRPSGAN